MTSNITINYLQQLFNKMLLGIRRDVASTAGQSKNTSDNESEMTPLKSATSPNIYEQEYGSVEGSENGLFGQKKSIATALRKEDQQLGNQYFVSTMIVYYCVLTAEMARGILFPTLWLYVSSFGGTKSFQGLAVSAFSMGRIISAPYLGHLSEVHGHQFSLIICNIIIIIGCFIYSSATSLTWLLLGQLTMGLGAGSLGVTRSFVAETTPTIRRTEYIAYLTALQYAGFTVTPVLGSILSTAFQTPSPYHRITKFSAPAYFLALMSFVSILLLIFHFQNISKESSLTIGSKNRGMELSGKVYSETSSDVEERAALREGEKVLRSNDDKSSVTSTLPREDEVISQDKEGDIEDKVMDEESSDKKNNEANTLIEAEKWRGFILNFGMFLNFVTKGSIGVFETLMIIITIKYFHWDEVKTGFIISIFGAIGVIILLNFSLLLKYFKDYQLVPLGMVFMVVSCLLLNNNYFLFSFSYNDSLLVVSLICMLSIGYPVGHTTLIGLFSRLLLLQEKQGKALGLFASVGSLARIIFPIMAGLIMDYYHHFNIIFLVLGAILFVSLIAYWRFESLIAKLLL